MNRDVKRISKNTLIVLLVALMSACLFGFFGVSVKSKADAAISEIQLKTQYNLYENVYLPDATITFGDSEYEAEKIAVFPSGTAYCTSSFVASEEGLYKIQYRAKIGQDLKVFEKTFNVSGSLFSASGATEIAYGYYDATEHDPNNIGTTGRVEGLKVSLSAGDTITYNQAIDLNDYGRDELLIQCCVTPNTIGTPDSLLFYIYLTDAYDPSNVITIYERLPSNYEIYGNTYTAARAFATEKLTGWEWNSGVKHAGDNYGSPFALNTSGILNNTRLTTIADNTFQIAFDYSTKELLSPVRASSANPVVCDFDNPRDFGTLWDGFTTGECYISVYSADAFNFVITKIGRQDLTDTSFNSRNAVINVDLGDYSADDLPTAEVGSPYGLFGASCLSPYFGRLEVIPRVYANYGEPEQFEVLVEDGKFIPAKEGEYSLVYEVTDYFGETLTKVFTIEAVNELPEMSFDFTGIDNSTSALTGEYVSLGYPKVINASGNAVIKAYLKSGETETEITGGGFRTEAEGEYTVIIRATDHCERTVETEYGFTAEHTDLPTFVSEPILSDFFISGETYSVPAMKAYNFTDGSKAEIDAKITVIDDEGERIVRKGTFVPFASKNGKYTTIRYSASVAGGEDAVLEYNIPTIVTKKNDDLILKNYFYATEGKIMATEVDEYSTNYVVYGDIKLGFVKPVMADGFNFKFGFVRDFAALSEVNVYLKDSENPKEIVRLRYYIEDGKLTFKVNDDPIVYPVSQVFDSNDVFTVSYSAQKNGVIYDTFKSSYATIKRTMYGEEFKGFSSHKILFSISVEGVTSMTKVRIDSVNGQLINNDVMEFVGPNMTVTGVYGGTQKAGDRVVIPMVVAEDVVTSSSRVTVSVRDPDGNYVITTDGIELRNKESKEYTIEVSKMGRYLVSFVASDAEGNTEGFSYVINVLDEEPPVITVKEEIKKNYKLGDTVYLSSATATDNITQNPEVHVDVITPKGAVFSVENRNGYAFRPISAGTYKIIYWCIDEQGNMETFDFEIVVSE